MRAIPGSRTQAARPPSIDLCPVRGIRSLRVSSQKTPKSDSRVRGASISSGGYARNMAVDANMLFWLHFSVLVTLYIPGAVGAKSHATRFSVPAGNSMAVRRSASVFPSSSSTLWCFQIGDWGAPCLTQGLPSCTLILYRAVAEGGLRPSASGFRPLRRSVQGRYDFSRHSASALGSVAIQSLPR